LRLRPGEPDPSSYPNAATRGFIVVVITLLALEQSRRSGAHNSHGRRADGRFCGGIGFPLKIISARPYAHPPNKSAVSLLHNVRQLMRQ
jgi:hypothetical protein